MSGMLPIIIVIVVLGGIGAMIALYVGIDRSQRARRDVAHPDEEQYLAQDGTVGEVIGEDLPD